MCGNGSPLEGDMYIMGDSVLEKFDIFYVTFYSAVQTNIK